MATPAVDFDSALRSEVHSFSRGAGDSAPTPEPVPAQPEPASDPGSPPAPEPEVAAPVEAAPGPDQAPEGSTPQGQPAPAETSTSAFDKLVARYGGDREKAASEMLAMESRFAAMVKEQKTKEKEAPATAPSAAAPVAPVVPPAVVAPTAAPEPPVQRTTAPPVDVTAQVTQAIEADVECRALVDQYATLRASLQQIAANDQVLEKEITNLQLMLQSSEVLKKRGIEVPELDALARQDIERSIQSLELQRIKAETSFQKGERQLAQLHQRFESKKQQVEGRVRQVELTARAEADKAAEVETLATSFSKNWDAQLPEAFKAFSVPEKLQSGITKMLRDSALARVEIHGAFTADSLAEFIKDRVKGEMENYNTHADEYHRLKSAEYGKAKEADVKRVTPGPAGKGAVAATAKTETGNFDEKLRAELRSRIRARSA